MDLGDRNSVLQHCVPVSNRNLVVFERLMVDRYAGRRSYFILPAIKLADRGRIVINGTHRSSALQGALDIFRQVDYRLLVLGEGQHRHLYGSKIRMEL